ncbi:peptide-methionine (S)-S-oxide reductase [Shewanella sp. Choline-02u-19]|jgi:peptide-methionine (S)-S-oxide reductase|uniref:peptide-methionine (S)-S-oxide reductase MsrA n=1 Tax=unclassified Shewanella TaxID=196818 RepID=UPI000C34F2DA|nr:MULTISPECIES: peptide-methionine (S)-S-oxide reductase MsrA [unclassified Shewanella]PKG58999.1 peptide-methionine (S)-S-oxide reductase [Shewanella sp. GutDb-MelDb]PKG73734.1 peptide-methionine (S)-S-oxide reductase [Shewanella sp. GutCb]PKH56342.1 peptide-methionine (S)-S-oxide reductase [Shewanella sp. Bg11-22]PKI27564.1 peptide-methionine (S)-S-oxide reductase [Shewanella sp. Choline-02u-19]
MAYATFGAGCFWGVEYFFKQVDGVTDCTCGYMGGNDLYSSYSDVKAGNTGHAEVVQIEFDPSKVGYETLLDIFWQNHNPTTLNQQGEDKGNQYRSCVFFHNTQQRSQAEKAKLALIKSSKWGDKQIVTEIVPTQQFHEAETYHQDYLAKNDLPSCHISF